MTKLFQLVLLATALISALAGPVASLMADGGGPWPDPPSVNLVNS
ncbi:MAG: hypothetical protein ACRD2U_17435 [Terriglobales bacterium]